MISSWKYGAAVQDGRVALLSECVDDLEEIVSIIRNTSGMKATGNTNHCGQHPGGVDEGDTTHFGLAVFWTEHPTTVIQSGLHILQIDTNIRDNICNKYI